MTEKQYAERLDQIIFALSDVYPGEPGIMGSEASIIEIKIEQKDKGYPRRVSDIRNREYDLLCHVLNMDSVELMGFLIVLEENRYIETTSSKGGATAKITPRGLVFLNSGGFTRELKDQNSKRKIARNSAWAAVGSAIVAGALLFLTALQAWLAFDANPKGDDDETRIKRTEESLQILESKIDSLSVQIKAFPVNKPDTLL